MGKVKIGMGWTLTMLKEQLIPSTNVETSTYSTYIDKLKLRRMIQILMYKQKNITLDLKEVRTDNKSGHKLMTPDSCPSGVIQV